MRQEATKQPTKKDLISAVLEQNLIRWIPAIFAVLIFVNYFPVWQNSFVYNKKLYIILNHDVTLGDTKTAAEGV